MDLVVPVHNHLEMTYRFLSSLKRMTRHPFRLILVDNGSDALPESLIEGFDEALLIRCAHNLGFGGGCNAGLASTRNPLVLVMNNDLILTQGWLSRMVEAISGAPSMAACAPSTNYATGDQEVVIRPFKTEREMHGRAEAFQRRYAGLVEDVPFATGMCLLLRRDVLLETGGFDERFGLFEDNDLCLRIKNLGHRIVLARDTFLYHLGSRTFQSLGIDHEELLEENRRRFREKWEDDPYSRGLEQEDQGDIQGALRSYLASIKEDRPNPEPLFRTAVILFNLGRHEAACSSFRAYLERCPESSRAMIGLGCALISQGAHREGAGRIMAVLRDRYVRDEEKKNLMKRAGAFSERPPSPFMEPEEAREIKTR